MIDSVATLEAVRRHAAQEMEECPCRILVCSGTGCIATGSEKIYQIFSELTQSLPQVELEFAPHEGQKPGVKKPDVRAFASLALWYGSRRESGSFNM